VRGKMDGKKLDEIAYNEFLDMIEKDISLPPEDHEINNFLSTFKINPILYIKTAFYQALDGDYEKALKRLFYFKKVDIKALQELIVFAETLIKCFRDADEKNEKSFKKILDFVN
jgi:hypothetical protein